MVRRSHATNQTLSIRRRLQPISVAYYRAGYTPTDYPSEVEWQGRELIESSAAAKCPSVSIRGKRQQLHAEQHSGTVDSSAWTTRVRALST